MRQTRGRRARAILQPWLQGPRPVEVARRRLSHSRADGWPRQGGQCR